MAKKRQSSREGANYTKEELEAYLFHERGHMNFAGRIMTAVYASIIVFVFFFLYLIIFFVDREIYLSAVKMGVYILIFLIMGWILNGMREYYADYYSWNNCCGKKALISALKKIDSHKRQNLWQNMLRNYTHPPLSSRIKAIERSR
jgi:Zn-dependent protease with chaperone function